VFYLTEMARPPRLVVWDQHAIDLVILHARRRRLHRVEAALAAGFNVNAANSERQETLLHTVAHKCGDIHCSATLYLSITTLALTHGGNPNARNKYGQTPVFLAARYGKASVLRELVAGGGDVNLTCHGGESPLLVLVWGNNNDATDRLWILLQQPSLDLFATWRGATAEQWAHLRDGGRCSRGSYRARLAEMLAVEVGPGSHALAHTTTPTCCAKLRNLWRLLLAVGEAPLPQPSSLPPQLEAAPPPHPP
jgi:hypothetical protein